MHEFIEFIKAALTLKTVSESTAVGAICPGGINRGSLIGKIESRYGIKLSNTEISRCPTVADLKRKIDVKIVQQEQARDNGRCNAVIVRNSMMNAHF